MTIGKKIERLRLNKKLTQEKLADKLDITRQTLSNWESDITTPDLKQAKKLSNIFGVSLDELVGNELNVIQEKLVNTEKLTIKQTKFIKVLLVTIYFIVLLSVIGVGVYFYNKLDFTSDMQLDFVCSGYYEDKYEEVKLELHYEPERCIGDDCEKYGRKDATWALYIYSNDGLSGRRVLGKSMKESLEELNLMKKLALNNGLKCK